MMAEEVGCGPPTALVWKKQSEGLLPSQAEARCDELVTVGQLSQAFTTLSPPKSAQASPTPSPLPSSWPGLKIPLQLSSRSGHPSALPSFRQSRSESLRLVHRVLDTLMYSTSMPLNGWFEGMNERPV